LPTSSAPSALAFLIGLLSSVSGGIGQASPAPAVPGAIAGSWVSDCHADLPERIRFVPTGAATSGSSGTLKCRATGYRASSDVRWYLDLECSGGNLLQLDVYLVAADELLLARRPLGEACRYKREPG
jgi:hypothetical protein